MLGPVDCVVGLGSNLGERRELLAGAVAGCARLGELAGVSWLYETDPIGPPQPVYLNAALRLRTELAPEALLDALLELERAAGRRRRERWGPRTLDLDVLWIAGCAVRSPRLTVPHPRLAERAFALLPLLDVAPDARAPDGSDYARRLAGMDLMGVRRTADGGWWRSAKILRSWHL